MGVVMQVVSSGGGKGKAGLSRYIAEREKDPEREGKENRPLFSRDRDNMTYRQADRVLAQGEVAPEKDDLIHIVISLRPGDYERLGESDDQRKENLKEAVREAMQGVEKDLGVRNISWIAGIHLNTDNPHVHIGMNKNMEDIETGEPRRVETIPMSLRGEQDQERTPDDGKPQKVTSRFNEAIEKRSEPITHIAFQVSDREGTFRRELVTDLTREPSNAERVVGSWIMLEIDPATSGEPAREARRLHLRSEVRRMDRDAREQGTRFVAAYIPKEDLDKALVSGQIKALRGDMTQHRPYQTPEQTHAQEQPEEGRSDSLKERTILGRELAARLRVVHLSQQLEAAERQGNVRAYTINDPALNVERKSSASDLAGRADSRSGRLARESDTQSSGERVEIRRGFYATEMTRNTPALVAIEEQHAQAVAAVSGMLDKALDRHDGLVSQASRIEREYRAQGQEPPTPIMPRDVLEKLHEQAVDRRDVARINQLEGVRVSLAREFEGDRRDDATAARLVAQHAIARQDERVSEKRRDDFERTSHLRKFDINGQRLSLSDVDRDIKNKEREAEHQSQRAEFYDRRLSLFGNFRNPFTLESINPVNRVKVSLTSNPLRGIGQIPFGPTINPLKRAEYRREAEAAREAGRQAQEAIERHLQPTRTEIERRIEAQRAELQTQHESNRELRETLNGMRQAEAGERAARGAQMPQASYSPWELRRMETNAGILRDRDLLSEYEALAQASGASQERLAARAFAREDVARVALEGASQRLDNFTANRERTPVSFTDREGVERTGTLREFSPQNLYERVAQKLFENPDTSFNRDAVQDALTEHERMLAADRDTAREYYEATKLHAENYRDALRGPEVERTLPAPEYTRQELASIERYSVQLTDEGRRQEFENLVRNAVEDGRVGNHPLGQQAGDRGEPKIDNEPEKSWQSQAQDAGDPKGPGQSVNTSEPTLATGEAAAPGAAPAAEASLGLEIPIIIP